MEAMDWGYENCIACRNPATYTKAHIMKNHFYVIDGYAVEDDDLGQPRNIYMEDNLIPTLDQFKCHRIKKMKEYPEHYRHSRYGENEYNLNIKASICSQTVWEPVCRGCCPMALRLR